MDTDNHRWETNKITEVMIGTAYKIGNTLGSGFLEKVYENALAIEIRKNGLLVVQQHPINVKYEGAIVGEFIADLLAQCLNYLKATGLHVCLLINFGNPKVEIKRIML
ncbi:MAG TPA: GxxExxY protein [Verrucomicrobiae bacterium]